MKATAKVVVVIATAAAALFVEAAFATSSSSRASSRVSPNMLLSRSMVVVPHFKQRVMELWE